MTRPVTILPVTGLPEVAAGDDLAALVAAAVALEAGDVVVVSSKVVSKAGGLWADSREDAIAASTVRVVAERWAGDRATRVVEATAGPVMAAGGVDASNTGGRDAVLLLPTDPDGAAAALRAGLAATSGLSEDDLGVVVTDTAGRPWRGGQTDFALGSSGVVVVDDLRGGVDADGRPLAVTARAVGDELAAAADLVKGKVGGVPVAVVRGLAALVGATDRDARSLVRQGPGDWFRLGHVEAVRAALGVETGSPTSEAVGIRALRDEPLVDRVRRAVAVAAHGEGDVTATISPDGTEVTVTAESDYAAGRFAARLDVAFWADDLDPADVRVRFDPPLP